MITRRMMMAEGDDVGRRQQRRWGDRKEASVATRKTVAMVWRHDGGGEGGGDGGGDGRGDNGGLGRVDRPTFWHASVGHNEPWISVQVA